MLKERSIDDVVASLLRAQENGVACTVLIGSGCSVTAGIPTAEEFVGIVRNKYPRDYERAASKTYFGCMAQLSAGDRRDLIAAYINSSSVNWAHIAIAQLMNAGLINRVLTTNFDPLVVRACALLGKFPAVYDVTASENFNAGFISDPSVFYLHGQHTGFVLINTPSEFEQNSRRLAPVFQDAVRRTTWIVVGYSGDNDPVLDHLAKLNRFDYNLYWVGYLNNPPLPMVRERLLEPDKDAFYVKGFDADDFFVKLAHKLGCFPPDFVSKPFSHLQVLLASLTTYSFAEIGTPSIAEAKDSADEKATVLQTSDSTTPTPSNTLDVMGSAREMIRQAIDEIESMSQANRAEPLSEGDVEVERTALSLLMAGEYDKVIALRPQYARNPQPQLASHIAWAYVMQGTEIAESGKKTTGVAAGDLFARACELFQAALEIKPDMKEALNNYGVALYRHAENEIGREADRLFGLAYDKLSKVLQIDPYAYDSLKNWGDALSAQAQTKVDPDADRLFAESYQKYQESVAIDGNQVETFFSWGNTLFQQAQRKANDEGFSLCILSGEKYQAALTVDSTHDKSLHNWGVVLTHQAEIREGKESDDFFDLAYSAYCEALRIKPDKHESLENWGNALSKQAQRKVGRGADLLYQRAYELYAAALRVKPMNPRALDNWGTILTQQAQTKVDAEADRIFSQAHEKFAEALAIEPTEPEALYGWGVALLRQAVKKQGETADALYERSYEKLGAALELKPNHYGAMFNFVSAAFEQALTKSGNDADALFRKANARFEAALGMNQNMYQAVAMLGLSLFEQGKTKSAQEAEDLYNLAYERFESALRMKPDFTNVLINWGTALYTDAKGKVGEEADSLFALAYEKFHRVNQIDPTLHEALNNWGAALSAQARTKMGPEADVLYNLACQKFRDAMNLKPDFYLAHLNLGTTRLYQAGNRDGKNVDKILVEAEKELLAAESLQSGDPAYNLACVYARQGKEIECREWLERTKALGKLPEREHIEGDPDLQSIRERQWLRDFLDSL